VTIAAKRHKILGLRCYAYSIATCYHVHDFARVILAFDRVGADTEESQRKRSLSGTSRIPRRLCRATAEPIPFHYPIITTLSPSRSPSIFQESRHPIDMKARERCFSGSHSF